MIMRMKEGIKVDSKVEKNFIKIAEIVSNNDKVVMDEVKECLSDPEKYLKDNAERYGERGIYIVELEDIIDDISELEWIGLVDILDINDYVCERDYKDELEDFVYFMSNLKGVKENNLIVDEEWFDEEDGITEWCEILDEKWEEQDYCVAAFDIDSDSYVLFPCSIEDFKLLQKYADEAEYRIDLGKEM